MSKTFFTADLRFGDREISKIVQRPFVSTRQMDNALIANWNSKVSAGDQVYIIGGFSCADWKRTREAFKALNGRKIFCPSGGAMNNADMRNAVLYAGWHMTGGLQDFVTLMDGGRQFFYAYPLPEERHFVERQIAAKRWPENAITLHGDSLGKLKPLNWRIDVGVDSWGYAPVQAEELIAFAKTLPTEEPQEAA